ncbi:MAG: hypothetical protein KDI81_17935, partial [Xanthomonadales bacterium]|nr:hypothetical protein [Xanthomonadales bacterium]
MRGIPAMLGVCATLVLAACASAPTSPGAPAGVAAVAEYYGTLEPFANEAVYFVVTDRFVNGDPRNDQR